MSKGKGQAGLGYSHPLVKNLEEPVEEDHQIVLPSYQPIIPNNTNRISSKIARCTYIPNTNYKKIAMTVSPFNNAIQTLPQKSFQSQCSFCKAKANPFSNLENHSTLSCYYCGNTTQLGIAQRDNNTDFGYRIVNSPQSVKNSCQKKKVCFAIQASQYIYEANIHKSIFQCLEAMQGQNIEVAFVLFDNQYLMFINPYSLQLTKMKIRLQSQELQELPLDISEMFIDIASVSSVEELVQNIVYQAFLIKQTLLPIMSSMLSHVFSEEVAVRYFISSLGTKQEEIPSKTKFNPITNVLKTYQSSIAQKIINKQPQSFKKKGILKMPINSEFYILPINASYREAVSACGFNLAKIYSIKQIKQIQNCLYYDLFESLGKKVFINSLIAIRTPKFLELTMKNSQIDSLYGNLEVKESLIGQKIKQYSILIKKADQFFTLPLEFHSTNDSKQSDLPLIQIEYTIQSYHEKESIILNVSPFQNPQRKKGIQSYDDQLVFNNHMRRCLSQWQGQNYKQLKQEILWQSRETVWMLKNYSDSQSISFSKNWKHYMLYSFLIDSKLSKGGLNCYNIYQYVTSTLEQFSKRLYHRAYRLEEGKIKNIKFLPTAFEKYNTIFVDNGQCLFLVFADPSVQEIKKIFGCFDSIPALSRKFPELPQLSTNQPYRKAIQLIRRSNQFSFLPLKIIDYQSYLFTELIEPQLYLKDEHLTFLRRLWRNA